MSVVIRDTLNSRNIADCTPLLREVWEYVDYRWNELYPSEPNPILTQTYRGSKIQDVFFMQGRETLDTVNAARKTVNLPPLKATENRRITNVKGGSSKHNVYPAKAFDIAFIDRSSRRVIYEEKYFKMFWDIVCEKYEDKIRWGGNFRTLKDAPHYEEIL